MIQTIMKRNGEVVLFDASKIRNAILKANSHISGERMSDYDLDKVTAMVVDALNAGQQKDAIPNVEEIQDMVEEKLIESDLPKTAKAYILYRAEHQKMREMNANLMKIYENLTFQPSSEVDLKRENANIDADTAMGTMLKYGSEGAKAFYDEYVIPREIAQAHINGDIHIHDKDFYALTETCCQINLLKLFKNGFSTGHGYLREPNDIRSYSALCCIAIQANQNEMHGGQSIPNFDYAMAPGVTKTFRKQYFKSVAQYLQVRFGFTFEQADEWTSAVKEDVGKDVSLGTAEAYGKKLAAYLVEKMEGKISPEEAEKAAVYCQSNAYNETDNATYQAMEALVHNLNTMNSRAGAQVPFSSLNYGTDVSPEGRMVIRNLLQATEAGLGDGETPIFPVQIFKVKEGINYNEGEPNYDLFKMAIRVSAKRLFPNFSFLDAPFNLQYYRPGDYDSEVAYMGCRTRVMGNVYDPNREVTCGRGNLSFTTINLPRLGIEAHGNLQKFFSMLDDRIDLCIEQLLHRFKIQCSKKVYNYPFLMGQGVWIDSEKLSRYDTVEEVLKHGTLSIGLSGWPKRWSP